jgi:hypothetical protein
VLWRSLTCAGDPYPRAPGLTLKLDSGSLLLTLEPEAAALTAVLEGDAAVHLAEGDVLQVLDCGGGTADAVRSGRVGERACWGHA